MGEGVGEGEGGEDVDMTAASSQIVFLRGRNPGDPRTPTPILSGATTGGRPNPDPGPDASAVSNLDPDPSPDPDPNPHPDRAWVKASREKRAGYLSFSSLDRARWSLQV